MEIRGQYCLIAKPSLPGGAGKGCGEGFLTCPCRLDRPSREAPLPPGTQEKCTHRTILQSQYNALQSSALCPSPKAPALAILTQKEESNHPGPRPENSPTSNSSGTAPGAPRATELPWVIKARILQIGQLGPCTASHLAVWGRGETLTQVPAWARAPPLHLHAPQLSIHTQSLNLRSLLLLLPTSTRDLREQEQSWGWGCTS